MELRIKYADAQQGISVSLDCTIAELRQRIATATGVAVEHQWVGGIPRDAPAGARVSEVLCDGDELVLTDASAALTQQTLAETAPQGEARAVGGTATPPRARSPGPSRSADPQLLPSALRQLLVLQGSSGNKEGPALLCDEAAAGIRRKARGGGQGGFEEAAAQARRVPCLLLCVVYDATQPQSLDLLLALAAGGDGGRLGALLAASEPVVWVCDSADPGRMQSVSDVLERNTELSGQLASFLVPVHRGGAAVAALPGLPFCFVCAPETGRLLGVSACSGGVAELEEVMRTANEEHGARLAEIREVLQADSVQEELRREQDTALEAAKQIDGERDAKRRREQEEAAEATAASREFWLRRAAVVQRGLERSKARTERPAVEHGVRVAFRLPDGSTSPESVFAPHETLKPVWEALDADEACRRTWRDPVSCTLLEGYPRKRYSLEEHGELTLSELLGPRGARGCTLFLVEGEQMPQDTVEALEREKRSWFERKQFQVCKAIQQRIGELRMSG